MMAQPVPHQTPDKRRVKVYELRHNDWFDRGTGFCYACYVLVEEGQPKEPRVVVESEDQPNRRLLETKIVKDDGFQKQQGMRSRLLRLNMQLLSPCPVSNVTCCRNADSMDR